MDKTYRLKILSIHILAWIITSLIISGIENLQRLYYYAPFHYISTCLLLIPVFYLSNYYIKKRKILPFLFIMAGVLAGYLYIPILLNIAFSPINYTTELYSLSSLQQAKMRMGTMILFLSVWGSSILLHMYTLQRNNLKLRQEKTQAELLALKSQIDPHFFFNSLNAIYFLSFQKSELAPKAIITLSEMMRYVLTETTAERLPLKQECAYIKQYIDMMRMRLPEKTKLNFQLNIEDEEQLIAPLLFIPLVENAFKYGTSTSKEVDIHIQLDCYNQNLDFKVRNQIIHTRENKPSTSTGLANLQKRLQLLYPEQHTLLIQDNHQEYFVQLQIQLP